VWHHAVIDPVNVKTARALLAASCVHACMRDAHARGGYALPQRDGTQTQQAPALRAHRAIARNARIAHRAASTHARMPRHVAAIVTPGQCVRAAQ
jgi:hypothetical protein